MVQGRLFLKGEGGGRRGLAAFLFNFFEGLLLLDLEITLHFAKLFYAYEEKWTWKYPIN